MAHIDAVAVVVAQNAVNIVGILLAAVICLGLAHFYLVLWDLRDNRGALNKIQAEHS